MKKSKSPNLVGKYNEIRDFQQKKFEKMTRDEKLNIRFFVTHQKNPSVGKPTAAG